MSDGKPDLDKLLVSLVQQLRILELVIDITVNNEAKHLRFFLLFSVFDEPARAAVLNLKNWTGYFGCLRCYQSGHNMEYKSKNLIKNL